jgi:RimJ/RimL family protein N-acetyltransferase
MQLETDRLVIKLLTEADAVAVLRVYERAADFLELQTPEPPSLELVRSDMAATASQAGVFAGVFKRASGELMGIVSFVPGNFRGQRDYAFVSLIMLRESDRGQGFGSEAYRAVEDFIFGDPLVTRIGTLLLPQHAPSLKFAEKIGFERAGGPFKNRRGYGLWAFVKKRPGLAETPGELIWRETKKALSEK